MNRALLLLITSRTPLLHSFRICGAFIEKAHQIACLHAVFPWQVQKTVDYASRRVYSNATFQESTLEEYLKNLLACSDESANKILTNHPKIRKTSRSDLAEATQALKEAEVTIECIVRYPWLLTLCPVELKSKLNILSSAKAIDSVTLPLLRHEEQKLQAFISKKCLSPPYLPERIKCLCRCLEIEPEELSERILGHSDLLIMNLQKVQNIVDLLKEAKVPRHLLASDLWLFYFKEEKIAKRFLQIKALNAPVKPWILRASRKDLETWIGKRKKKIEIFGEERDYVDYLAERLQCSHEFVTTTMISRNAYLPSINPLKLKQVLDFLFEKGYTADDIRNNPAILSRSLNTTRERVLQIEKLGFHQPHLKLLRQASRDYESNLKKIQSASKCLENSPPDGSTTEKTLSSTVKVRK